MKKNVFVFLAQGLATQSYKQRTGARHAMLIFATGNTIADGRLAAVTKAQDRFWTHIEIKGEKEIDPDTYSMGDETLRNAAKYALANGASIIVYADEIPLDS